MGDKSDSLGTIFGKIEAISICESCKAKAFNILAELRAGLEGRFKESNLYTPDEIRIMIDNILYTQIEDITIAFTCQLMKVLDELKDNEQ